MPLESLVRSEGMGIHHGYGRSKKTPRRTLLGRFSKRYLKLFLSLLVFCFMPERRSTKKQIVTAMYTGENVGLVQARLVG